MDFKTLTLESLENLIRNGGEDSFLIIDSDEYYMQFLYSSITNSLHCEVVSDIYLSEKLKLTSDDKSLLLELNL